MAHQPNFLSATRRAPDFGGWLLHTLALAAMLAALVVLSPLALAQGSVPVCGPRADVIQHLAGSYHEQTVAVGIANDGTAIYEILTSAEGATWTLLYSLPSGVTCLMATGQDWQSLPAVAFGPEA